MANVDPSKASSSSQVTKEVQEATVEIHIKTLDSQIYTFRVENNTGIALLKEKIASAIGVPAGQQRLIFRGRVLKDDHTLSQYHVEDGHTLHLVARQPVQTQTQSGINSDQSSSRNGNRGNDVSEGTQRTRIGHSVVVGLNVTDQGEGTVADISRIVGAVLNSFGIGIANNTLVAGNSSSSAAPTILAQAPEGVETGGQNANEGVQTGNLPHNLLTGTLLRQMVTPDSLTTLSAYMTRMEQTMSLHNGNAASPQADFQDNTSSSSSGYPNVDALITVIDQAQRLLSGPAAVALRHLSGSLERERTSSEIAVRGQLQAEAMHVGVTMQHLGSLLLELGRTVSTLRMGEPPVEPMVFSGPAVYINASGPNPLMVQPNSHQPMPIFGIPSVAPLVNIGVPEQVVLGDTPRNISIHVHAGNSAAAGTPIGSAANVGEVARGQPANSGLPIINIGNQGESGLTRVLPSGIVVAAIPAGLRPGTTGSQGIGANYSADTRLQSSGLTGVSHPVTGIIPHTGEQLDTSIVPPESGLAAHVNTLATAIVNVEGLSLPGSNLQFLGNRSQRNHDSGVSQSLSSTDAVLESVVSAATATENTSCAATISNNIGQNSSAHILQSMDRAIGKAGDMGDSTPQALGISSSGVSEQNSHSDGNVASGGVARESFTEEKVPTCTSNNDKSYSDGHSIESVVNDPMHASGSNRASDSGKPVPLGLGLGRLQPTRRFKRTISRGKNVISNTGSSGAENEPLIAKGQQVLQSLVSQSSKQKQDKNAGNRSTAQGSTQQVGDQTANLGGMFSGMLQQMMPAVSQMLGMRQSTPMHSSTVLGSQGNNRDGMSNATLNQADLQDAVERIAQHDSVGSIFRAVLQAAGQLYGEHNFIESLGNDEELANEFVEMLCRHLHQRLQSGSGSGSGSLS